MKTKGKKISLISSFAMAVLLLMSFGVCSGFTVRGESYVETTEQVAEPVQAALPSDTAQPYSTTADGTEVSGLGYSINAVTTEYLDVGQVKDGASVFDETWLHTQIENGTKQTINSTDLISNSQNSFTLIEESCEVKVDASVKAGSKIFTANVSTAFSAASGMNYAHNKSQYYYALQSYFRKYSYALPQYAEDTDRYRSHLSAFYTQDVGKVLNGQMRPEDFFARYGTHIIMKGIYGGKIEIYYSAASNTVDVGRYYKSTIDSAVKAGIADMLSASSQAHFDLGTALNVSTTEINERFYIKAFGGNAFTGMSIANLNTHYSNWLSTVNQNVALVETSQDGLLPLWKMLPEQYNKIENINKLKQWYSSYAENYSSENETQHTFVGTDLGQTYTPAAKYKNSKERLITDAGPLQNEEYDTVILHDYMPFTRSELLAMGFTKISLWLNFDMKQINHGYQWFYIYLNLYASKELVRYKLDVPYSTVYKNYTVKFNNLSLSDFGNEFVIRYDGSGKKEDDWNICNLVVTITYSK